MSTFRVTVKIGGPSSQLRQYDVEAPDEQGAEIEAVRLATRARFGELAEKSVMKTERVR